ncbi:hypothetical protein [Bacillus sp. FJAT-50079]|nr:hypothetical protein [Bacillus sp. FJAT-50079]
MPPNKKTDEKKMLSDPEQVAEFMNNIEHLLKKKLKKLEKPF